MTLETIAQLAADLRAKYGEGAATLAEGLALASEAKGQADEANNWRKIALAVRDLRKMQPAPLLRHNA